MSSIKMQRHFEAFLASLTLSFQRPASMIFSGLLLKTFAILVGSVAALCAVQFFLDLRRLLRSIKTSSGLVNTSRKIYLNTLS
ncbi:hypothetical protein AZE42_00970 [Rhizopogon vesiculosus]|uniref:Uncharacterized protein n=1 Tax=Rhizopogon vesiculosus TaxID=180088 RepID=A0A1J8PIL4_9AGAM|nr:hypothetical protein AZE42_00970 [Rhizopogon vesiculosus]